MKRRLPAGSIGLALMTPILAAVLFFVFSRPIEPRITVAFATNPVMVWSYDREKEHASIVVLPQDAATEAAWGYGEYPLYALWKLGYIEKLQGRLFATSMEHALAVPIRWYIGNSTDGLVKMDDPVSYGKKMFSWIGLFEKFRGNIKTNLTFLQYFSLIWHAQTAKADKFTVTDLRSSVKTVTKTLPDGSTQTVLDTTQVDELLKGVFEDEQVRVEAKTIAVFNTVGFPTLGNRAARMVGTMGAFVVSVGNSEPAVNQCVVAGNKKQLESITATRIADVFGCVKEESADTSSRADLVLKVGKQYAAEF